jgi:hypothetical protein
MQTPDRKPTISLFGVCVPWRRLCGGSTPSHVALAARVSRRPTHRYHIGVTPVEAVAAAFAQWVVPDLPLYGMDHERGDFAP